MIKTTLNRIRVHAPCRSGWTRLLRHLGKTAADDEPLPFSVIVEACGLDDALWCCRAEPQHAREWRLFAAWCARQVQHLMIDERSLAALDVAESLAICEAEKLYSAQSIAQSIAMDAAMDAARAAARTAAMDAAWDAAVAAARSAAVAAAGAAAVAATRSSARTAARTAAGSAARTAAMDAARTAAMDAARAAQADRFLEIVQ